MKKGITVLACGLAAILLTVVMYLITVGTGVWGMIHFLSLFCVILAECVTTIYGWIAQGSPRKLAAAVFSGIMIPFAIALSVVYVVNFPCGYWTYLGWYFAATIVVNTICLLLFFFDSRKREENDSVQAAKGNMLMLRKLVKSIMVIPAAQPYQEELRALEEKLHFSNDCVVCAEDEKIQLLLAQLQEKIQNEDDDCRELLEKIHLLAEQRRIMSSSNV
jgi:hypothetical protein